MPVPESLAHIARCQHTKDDGARCGSPALRGRRLCYFHDRQRRTFPHRQPRRTPAFCRRADFFNVRTAEDILRSLNQVMNAIVHGQLSPKEAGSILFALQTATNVVQNKVSVPTVPHIPSVPHVRAANVGISRPTHESGSFDFISGRARLQPCHQHRDMNGASAPEVSPSGPSHNRRPRTVAEIFDMVPGCDDLRAMLTPDDIATLERDSR